MLTYLSALLILAAVLIGQTIGIHGLWIREPLFHIVMHIAGGIGIGLFICALINSGILKPANKRRAVIVGAFIAGLIWEFVEVRYNITGYKVWTAPYFLDTVKDLINDLVGGTLVAWLYYRNEI